MAVHVPLSIEAQAECRLLILSTNNILAPSNGKPIITPTQDMILGCYFLTVENPQYKDQQKKYFKNMNEAWIAWESDVINIHSNIIINFNGERIETTMGRVVINRTIDDAFKESDIDNDVYINHTLGKKQLSDLIYDWYKKYGNKVVASVADKLKDLGFKYATLSGISIAIDDLRVPSQKADILGKAEKEVVQLLKARDDQKIGDDEFFLK